MATCQLWVGCDDTLTDHLRSRAEVAAGDLIDGLMEYLWPMEVCCLRVWPACVAVVCVAVACVLMACVLMACVLVVMACMVMACIVRPIARLMAMP